MTDPFINPSFELAPTLGSDVVTASAAYVDDTVTYPITAIGATKLHLKIDSGNEQILDFVGTETTAANIVATLNALPIDGAIASVSGGQVRITSLTTGQFSFVEITGGDANLILQFPTTQVRGDDGSFEGDGVANWSATAATLTKESGTRTNGIGEQVLRITATGAPDGKASETILTVGKTYRVNTWLRGDGTCNPVITFDATYDMWTGGIASTLECGNTETYNLSGGETLTIKINGGSTQTITFVSTDFATAGAATAEEVATRISTELFGEAISTATSSGTKVTITTLRNGGDSSIEVTGGTANGVLGFSIVKTYGISSSNWEEADVTFVAQSADFEIRGVNAAAGLYIECDDLTITQVFSAYGEASPWQWNNSQAVGGFAEFNSVEPMPSGTPRGYESGTDFHLIAGYRAGREDFIAGWDDNHLWDSSLSTPSAVVFNENAPTYSGIIESFEIWDGANWIDGDPTYISPYLETVPTGWNGWYNDDLSVSTLPLEIENFEESWENDPFHSGYTWYSGRALTGVLYSSALTFPLAIGSWQADIYVLMRSATDDLYKMSITPQTFASASTLVTHLNLQRPAALINAGFIFASWTSGTTTGITWGWDGAKDTATTVYETFFVTIESNPFYKDARAPIGFNSLGWDSTQNNVLFPATLLTTLPAGVLSTDTLIVDSWSQVKYSTDDPYGTMILSMYGQTAAIFNTAIASEDHVEQFLIDGWFGAGSAWNPTYTAPEITAAIFTGLTTTEQFTDTDWANELMP